MKHPHLTATTQQQEPIHYADLAETRRPRFKNEDSE